jgi:ATP-dependent Clp protease adaptor protein ClpS
MRKEPWTSRRVPILSSAIAADEQEETPRDDDEGGTAVAEPPPKKKAEKPKGKSKPKPRPPKMLPPWRVLLHNDDVNTFADVITTLIDLTPHNATAAMRIALEADRKGVSLVLVTHRERAELYQDQFKSRMLTASIEPAE